jgi:hypothetical protein
MRRFIPVLALAGALACASPAAAQLAPAPKLIVTKIGHVPMVELNDGGAGLPYLGSSTPYDAGDWQPALRQYHDSGVYMHEIAQVDAVAKKTIDLVVRKAKKAARHARHGRRHRAHAAKKLAIVFDIDETALSNYSAIVADNFTFGPKSQAEATGEIGVAIKPTLAVFDDAKKRGVTPFFITGRPEAQRAPTVENLHREGFDGYKQLYLKPAGTTLTTVAYKSGARKDIEKQGYTIVANIGDQYSDLAGGHAKSAFKLPNPFYFLP